MGNRVWSYCENLRSIGESLIAGPSRFEILDISRPKEVENLEGFDNETFRYVMHWYFFLVFKSD
jgi:hypothetical protein